ncbi:hypothetical protein D3C81_2229340 [compost metagenome]
MEGGEDPVDNAVFIIQEIVDKGRYGHPRNKVRQKHECLGQLLEPFQPDFRDDDRSQYREKRIAG